MNIETLEPTHERKASAAAMIERIRAQYPEHERRAVFEQWLRANPEWISVFADLAIDLIDARLAELDGQNH